MKTFKLLEEAGVVSLTEYLNNITDKAEVQGIISDVIDSEDPSMHDLLIEVVLATKSSEIIELQFQECFHHYVFDIISRSELIRNEFISIIDQQLPSDDFRDTILFRFVNELLTHDFQKISDRKQVFSCQKSWNAQFNDERFQLLSKVLHQISINHSEAILKLLQSKFQIDVDLNWFFCLFILNHIDQQSKGLEDLKSELRIMLYNALELT